MGCSQENQSAEQVPWGLPAPCNLTGRGRQGVSEPISLMTFCCPHVVAGLSADAAAHVHARVHALTLQGSTSQLLSHPQEPSENPLFSGVKER